MQGLARCIRESTIITDFGTILTSNSSESAGNLDWFDPKVQRVTSQLEVIPYNRVSRSGNDKLLMPPPRITHLSLSDNKEQMVTAESVPTENSAVGKKHCMDDDTEIGIVSMIKFWTKASGNDKVPYVITATMAFPHGEKNAISALAIARNGQYACTTSNDENAFRVWCQTLEADKDNESRPHPVWICQYKVTTPSGFSNFCTSSQGVQFSHDGTTLCIVYGHMISLWDHRDATLLKTLRHINNEPIDKMEFVNSQNFRDFILTKSHNGVKLQSPYGDQSEKGWSFSLPKDSNAVISNAQAIDNEHILISVYLLNLRKTKIVCVDISTGEPCPSSGIIAEVPVKIQSIIVAGSRLQRKSNYVNIAEKDKQIEKSPVRLFIVTEDDELFLIQKLHDRFELETKVKNSEVVDNYNVPKIHVKINQKREALEEGAFSDEQPPMKRAAILSFMGDDNGEMDSSELPALSGNFLRAFISRNMSRRRDDAQ